MSIENETKLNLSEAARLAPGKPHVSAIWRHCRVGVLAANGERIKLEHTRFGRRVFTSAEAIERFGQRLAAADAEHFDSRNGNRNVTPKGRTPRQRERDIERATERLKAAGIAE